MLRLANDQGKVQWEIRAREILLPKHNTGITLVRGLQGATYFHDEKRKLTISADMLRYNPVTKNLEILGDVTVTGYENLTVTCDLVRWIAARQQVVCPGEVKAFMKQFSFRTRRVEIYPAANKLLCPNAIHLVAGTALVEGHRLTANLQTETVDMEGPIVMKAHVGEGKKPFLL